MKRRLIFITLCLTLILSLCLFTACEEGELPNFNGGTGGMGSTSNDLENCEHEYSEWHLITKATCVSEGEERRACVKCGNVEKRSVEKNARAHNFANGVCINAGCNAKYSDCASEGLEFVLNDDGESYSVSGIGTCTDTDLIIPAVYNEKSVTSIGEVSFYYQSGLTSITIPDSVTTIGQYAFALCSGLESINIPNSVTSIGEYAFSGCSGLESITVNISNTKYHSKNNCLIETESKTLILGCKNSIIPDDGSVTSIGGYAFLCCSGLTSITIPDGVNFIGDNAFLYCDNLDSVYISDIGAWCNIEFDGDANLLSYAKNLYVNGELTNEIIIPYGVTAIKRYAFAGCSAITKVIISCGVTEICEGAFSNCVNLASVIIPESVTKIEKYAFLNCMLLLENIKISDSVTEVGSNLFGERITIVVQIDGGGLGADWIEQAGKRFAEANKNTNWGVDDKGKIRIGVDVQIVCSSGVYVNAASKTSTTAIYELTSVEDLSGAINSGYVLDITDIMTEKMDYRNGVQVSVDDKIDEDKKSRFTYNGKYYAAPSAEYYPGMVYNVNLFNKKGYYFAASSEGTVKFTSTTLQQDFYFVQPNSTTGKSCGPDGVMGTSDDGLPSSLYELIVLCEKMADEDVSPIDFTGMYSQYSNFLLSGLMASMMGYDRMSGTYNFNGTYEVVTGYSDENLFPGFDGIKKPITKTVTVTEENGYYTTWAVEKYYAEAFLELAMQKGWLGSSCTSNGVSQREAMQKFIFSGMDGKEEIGMHVDGSFWYNEANLNGFFEQYKQLTGIVGELNPRTIAWMALPVTFDQSVTEGNGKGQTFIDMWNSMLVINANVKNDPAKMAAAKAFLQFLCTDSELSKYTSLTSITKSLNYDLTDSDYENMSDYGKRLWNMTREDSNNKVVYFMGNNKTFTSNSVRFSHGWELDNAFSVGSSPSYYRYRLSYQSSKLEEIFNIQKITKATWQSMYQGSGIVTD